MMLAVIVWYLWLITFSPCCAKQPVAGPFPTLGECLSMQNQSAAPYGQRYECESQYQP